MGGPWKFNGRGWAGQWPVEASALVGEFTQPARTEILVLNRGGQLMLWTPDGVALGSGQDGLVAQLPAGRWTTASTPVDATSGARLLAANVEGLVVSLDEKFQLLWQHKLAGETIWGQARPARLQTMAGSAFAFGDSSGTVTCLAPTGKVVWTNALGAGPVKAPPLAFLGNQREESLLVAAGATLFCLDGAGHVRWRRDLGGTALTRPETVSLPGKTLILCGTATGSLFGLDSRGEVLWECPTADTLNNRIVILPRNHESPLILCAGLWGISAHDDPARACGCNRSTDS